MKDEGYLSVVPVELLSSLTWFKLWLRDWETPQSDEYQVYLPNRLSPEDLSFASLIDDIETKILILNVLTI